MWKKIAIFQLVLILGFFAFWVGKETRAAEPLTRDFVTQTQEGSVVYIWSYQAGTKTWNVTSLDFHDASRTVKDISVR